MENIYRNVYCGEVTNEYVGKKVRIAGWVNSIRNLGAIAFLTIRDEKGIVQVVTDDETKINDIVRESTVTLTGMVRKREGDSNPNMKTGEVEIVLDTIEVLGKCKNVLPFEISRNREASEETRLKYRYLDLRNEKMHNNILLRSKVIDYIREIMKGLDFTEISTPIISTSSPEGARDFVIPSRNFKGKFYALPQAPQIYKQLLMVSGLNKYFQIAPCFRDEDARKDRTLEFYQLDFEMSFPTEEDIIEVGEEIFYDVFSKFTNKKVSPRPFRQIAYKDAMNMYGTDKPDLRNPLIIKDASEVLLHTTFKPFANSTIKVIVVDDIGTKPNSWFNEIVDYASSIGMPGIGYITLMEDGTLKGPIDKFLSEEERNNLIKEFDMKTNSVMFFIANRNLKVAQKFAGQIRDELGRKIGLIDEDKIELCIIKDFPMFEYDEKEKKWDFCHNPFSKPYDEYKDYDKFEDLEEIIAHQFDFVCNGFEMASGAIRNTDLDLITKGFVKVGYKEDVIEQRFNSMFTAFKYGVPPHGGMAPGIDRILMLILDEPNLREVQTFPTSSTGQDAMMGSPSTLDPKQLEELGLKIAEEE